MSDDKNYKIVIVGDGSVGKTCLLYVFAKNHFPVEYVPTVFDNYQKSVSYNSSKYHLALWDTAGQEDYKNLRTLAFEGCHLVILAFALDNPVSYENIATKWLCDLKLQKLEHIPRLLVGTKLDLAEDPKFRRKMKEETGDNVVTEREGLDMAQEVGAFGYISCSAKENKKVVSIFDACVKYLVDNKQKKKNQKSRTGVLSSFASEENYRALGLD